MGDTIFAFIDTFIDIVGQKICTAPLNKQTIVFVTNKIEIFYNTRPNVQLEYILNRCFEDLATSTFYALQCFVFSCSLHITNLKKELQYPESFSETSLTYLYQKCCFTVISHCHVKTTFYSVDMLLVSLQKGK